MLPMEKTWAERIDAAEQRGEFTIDEREDLIGDWDRCFVGEALHAAGVTGRLFFSSDIRDSRLVNLGAGAGGGGILPPLHHPSQLMEKKDFSACRERLALIQARVDELYPPPKVEIPALSDEPTKKREKVLA